MKDRFATAGLILTILLHGGVAVAVTFIASTKSDGNEDEFDPNKVKVVEAQIAFKKEAEKKQPQKRFKKPPPKKKIAGVSRDADKKVEPKKDKKEKKPDLSKYLDPSKLDEDDQDQTTEEDLDTGKKTKSTQGSWQGSKHGDPGVTETKCNRTNYKYKYFCDLAADLRKYAAIPQLFKGKGVAIGCLRLNPEGKIMATKLKQKSGEANVDGPIRIGLRKLQRARNNQPKKLPEDLLDFTTYWTCFKINA